MATPPTFVAEYETVWDTDTSPKTISVTVVTGELLCHCGISSDGNNVLATPTGGTSVTWVAAQASTTANKCMIKTWTVAPAGQTFTLSETVSTGVFGFNCLRFSGTDGVGASNKAEGSGSGPSVSLTTTADNSAVVVAVGDWSATDGTTRTWRTVNSFTPTAGNGAEKSYFRNTTDYATYVAVYPDAGTAGANSYGLSAPSQNWTIHAVEVKGTAGAVAIPPILVMPSRRST